MNKGIRKHLWKVQNGGVCKQSHIIIQCKALWEESGNIGPLLCPEACQYYP